MATSEIIQPKVAAHSVQDAALEKDTLDHDVPGCNEVRRNSVPVEYTTTKRAKSSVTPWVQLNCFSAESTA